MPRSRSFELTTMGMGGSIVLRHCVRFYVLVERRDSPHNALIPPTHATWLRQAPLVDQNPRALLKHRDLAA
jgi:hypothetical protein